MIFKGLAQETLVARAASVEALGVVGPFFTPMSWEVRHIMSWNPKSPRLRPAIVCYADILGFRDMTERALEFDKGEAFLQRIKRSLSKAYDKCATFRLSAELNPFSI